MICEQLTKNNLISEHKNLVKAIYEYDYFVNTFERAQETFELDLAVPEQICSFWNHFWYMLPDNPMIQRDPFNRICDFAEGAYLAE